MVTGFDYLGQDKALQSHWLKRFVAIVIDAVIIYVPLGILFSLLGVSSLLSFSLIGFFFFFYCALFDVAVGGTVGKMLMHMKAVAVTGQMSSAQVLMRNISKIFGPLLLLDWIIGMAIDTKDPRQKWTDTIARTSVIAYDQTGGT